jgi:hypothetical protein
MEKKYENFINEEVGIRKLKTLIKGYKTSEIYFHQDLDGVASALAIRDFFKIYYDIKLDDCHIIQYGGKEFAIKDHKEGNLPILVDFAHSKPMYSCVFDHHDKQTGQTADQSKYFKKASSNAQIISGDIAYSDIFTPEDINLIKTVDSADFYRNGIKVEEVQNSIFKYKKELTPEKNRFMMGFVVNRLLLAYKNKRITVKSMDGKRDHINRNVLECLVLDANPSLHSIYNNIRHYINNAKVADKLGKLATPETIAKNLGTYKNAMKTYDKKSYDEKYKIVVQEGGGNMHHAGSYDRYVIYANHPDANFASLKWSMGLIQVSCNPFREKALKDIDLGKITNETLEEFREIFQKIFISIDSIKYMNERDIEKEKKAFGDDYQGVGFKFDDLVAFYKNNIKQAGLDDKKSKGSIPFDITANTEYNEFIKVAMNSIYTDLNPNQKQKLSQLKISFWDIIIANSGGHPAITNIQGFAFLGARREILRMVWQTEEYGDVMNLVQNKFLEILKSKIDDLKAGKKVEYTSNIELGDASVAEDYDYYVVNKQGLSDKVSKEDFLKAGVDKGLKTDKKSGMTIDHTNKKVIAKFEAFENGIKKNK